MRSYTERLRVPAAYWWLGVFTAVTFASFAWAGFDLVVAAVSYVVICGGCCALPLLLWGRTTIEVSSGELRAGPATLPLAVAGEVVPLDEAQASALKNASHRTRPTISVRKIPMPREG